MLLGFTVFPASAGVILNMSMLKKLLICFPRIRGGDPSLPVIIDELQLVFPASAGVILNRRNREKQHRSFPRIRGGDPVYSDKCLGKSKFSPHPRG